MNQFANIEGSKGLLKDNYEPGDTLDLALKKRREALMQSKGMKPKEDIPKPQPEPGAQ